MPTKVGSYSTCRNSCILFFFSSSQSVFAEESCPMLLSARRKWLHHHRDLFGLVGFFFGVCECMHVFAKIHVCECSSVLARVCDSRQLVPVAQTRNVTLHLPLRFPFKLSRQYATFQPLCVWSRSSLCVEHFPSGSIFSWEVGDRDSLDPFPQAAIDKTD